MKKIVYQFTQSRNEGKAFRRNVVLSDHNDNRIVIILMASVIIKTIKGKLGFNLNTKDGDFLTSSKAIFSALSKDIGSFYSPPFAGMALMKNQISDFGDAITNAKNKGLGVGGAKMAAKTLLYGTLVNALGYINDLARLDQTNAVEIIEGAQMVVIGGKSHKKQDFAVKQGSATGEAALRCLAVMIDGRYQKATYYWQYSLDGGATWIDVPQTSHANTVIKGMTAGVPAKFRKQTFSTKTGLSKWCTAIDFTVQ